MTQENANYTLENEETELAVSIPVQQAAALYGLGCGILDLGNTANKKSVKKAVKRLKRHVRAELGVNGSTELLSQSKGAFDMTLIGVRNNPALEDFQRTAYLRSLKDSWEESFWKGVSASTVV